MSITNPNDDAETMLDKLFKAAFENAVKDMGKEDTSETDTGGSDEYDSSEYDELLGVCWHVASMIAHKAYEDNDTVLGVKIHSAAVDVMNKCAQARELLVAERR